MFDLQGNFFLTEPCAGATVQVRLHSGQVLLDRFAIQSSLGAGTYSTVYLAHDNIRNVEVALKAVPVVSESAAHQLKHEIDLNTRVVDHTHVLQIYDVHCATHQGMALLLVSMEYAEGGSLRQWLAARRDDMQIRRGIGVQYFKDICTGTHILHQAHIVHMDLKPENALFVNGILKISDLGISRRRHEMSSYAPGSDQAQPERPSGTPAYMSPEQFSAAHPDDIDHRSDIYSLGIILFEICHPRCRPPFGGSLSQLREHHLHTAPPRIDGLEENIAQVIDKSLQKDPANRYQSVLQLIDDLEGKAAPQPVPFPTVDLDLERDRKAGELWRQARNAMSRHNPDEAGRLCQQVLSLSSDHEEAQRLLEEIQQRYQQAQQFYAKIERGIGYQSLDEMSALLLEAVSVYPNHPDGHAIQTQLQSLTGQYECALGQGISAIGQGQWQLAQANFERARQINPGSAAVNRLVQFANDIHVQVETSRNSIDAALEQGNRRKALDLARGLDRYVQEMRQSINARYG